MALELTVRPADESDLADIAAIARSNGLSGEGSGADPAYVGHLLRNGRVVVASTSAGPVGFAAAIRVGGTTMLADLFVDPRRQSAGAGAALLGYIFSPGGARMTFSSQDPRAIALYTRAGMSARWALLYLRSDPLRLIGDSPSAPVVPTEAHVATAWEHRWHGVDRSAEYRYWTSAGRALLVGPPDAPHAVAVVTSDGVTHAAVAPDADPRAAVLDIVRTATTGSCLLHLPSTHPALADLLRQGFLIEDFDLFMTTDDEIPGRTTGVYDPGLC